MIPPLKSKWVGCSLNDGSGKDSLPAAKPSGYYNLFWGSSTRAYAALLSRASLPWPEPLFEFANFFMSAPAINWNCLRRLRETMGPGAEPLIQELIETFLEDLPPRVSSLCEAAAQGDWEGVHRWAHALKGSCATVGAEALAELFHRVDERAEDAEALLGPLDGAISQTELALSGWREAFATPP